MGDLDSAEYGQIEEQTRSNRRLYILMLFVFVGTMAMVAMACVVYKQNKLLVDQLESAKTYHSSFLGTLGDLRKKVDGLTTHAHHTRDQLTVDIHECLDCPIDGDICPCFDTISLRDTTNCTYTTGGNGAYTWKAIAGTANPTDLIVDGFGLHHCTNMSGNYLTISKKAGEDCMDKLVASCPKPSCPGHHFDPTCACDKTLPVPRGATSCSIYGKDDGEWLTKIDFGTLGGNACANAINSEGCASPPYGCLLENESEQSLISHGDQTCHATLCTAHQIYDACILQHGS